MTIRWTYFSLLILLTLSVNAQDTSLSKKHLIVPLKVDNESFDRIFGEHCSDTLINPKDKKIIYVLEKTSKSQSYVTAYKSGKKKWSVHVDSFFGDQVADIRCIDLYDIDNVLRIRVFNYAPKTEKEKVYHIDLSLKSGKLIADKITAK